MQIAWRVFALASKVSFRDHVCGSRGRVREVVRCGGSGETMLCDVEEVVTPAAPASTLATCALSQGRGAPGAGGSPRWRASSGAGRASGPSPVGAWACSHRPRACGALGAEITREWWGGAQREESAPRKWMGGSAQIQIPHHSAWCGLCVWGNCGLV